MKIYAGIGSRETPTEILSMMHDCAMLLAHDGYICSTGACVGADQAFATGANAANGNIYLHLPWHSYEKQWIDSLSIRNLKLFVLKKSDREAHNSVAMYHPNYESLLKNNKFGVIALHARNYNILFLPQQVDFIICWTKWGKISGGTGQAIRIAIDNHIKVFNLGDISCFNLFQFKLEERNSDLEYLKNKIKGK